MKNLKKTLQRRFIVLLSGSTLCLYIVSYVLVKSLIVKNGIDIEELNSIYKILGILLFIILSLSIYTHCKTLNKMNNDVNLIGDYLNEISEKKNYSATLKIENFKEFLQISIILKNIVKRLNQKEKKTSKK